MKQEVNTMEDGFQGHMAPTVVSMLKIKNECIRVVLAETLCTFIMMVRCCFFCESSLCCLIVTHLHVHCIHTGIIVTV